LTLFDDVFAGSQGVANQLIQKFGLVTTLRRETRVFSAATGDNTVTSVDYTIKMTPPSPYVVGRQTNTVIEAGDLRTIIAEEGLVITPNPVTDKIIYQGTPWQIVSADPIVSGERTAAYDLQLRQ